MSSRLTIYIIAYFFIFSNINKSVLDIAQYLKSWLDNRKPQDYNFRCTLED